MGTFYPAAPPPPSDSDTPSRVDAPNRVASNDHRPSKAMQIRRNRQTNSTPVVAAKTRLCMKFVKGSCTSTKCTFAHGDSELRKKPDLRKTKLCDAFTAARSCPKGSDCTYAHGHHELQSTSEYFKTSLCPGWKQGHCESGDYCRHAHGYQELRTRICDTPLPSTTASSTTSSFYDNRGMTYELHPASSYNHSPNHRRPMLARPPAEFLYDQAVGRHYGREMTSRASSNEALLHSRHLFYAPKSGYDDFAPRYEEGGFQPLDSMRRQAPFRPQTCFMPPPPPPSDGMTPPNRARDDTRRQKGSWTRQSAQWRGNNRGGWHSSESNNGRQHYYSKDTPDDEINYKHQQRNKPLNNDARPRVNARNNAFPTRPTHSQSGPAAPARADEAAVEVFRPLKSCGNLPPLSDYQGTPPPDTQSTHSTSDEPAKPAGKFPEPARTVEYAPPAGALSTLREMQSSEGVTSNPPREGSVVTDEDQISSSAESCKGAAVADECSSTKKPSAFVPAKDRGGRSASVNVNAETWDARRGSDAQIWSRWNARAGSAFVGGSRRQSVLCIDLSDTKPAAAEAYPLAALVGRHLDHHQHSPRRRATQTDLSIPRSNQEIRKFSTISQDKPSCRRSSALPWISPPKAEEATKPADPPTSEVTNPLPEVCEGFPLSPNGLTAGLSHGIPIREDNQASPIQFAPAAFSPFLVHPMQMTPGDPSMPYGMTSEADAMLAAEAALNPWASFHRPFPVAFSPIETEDGYAARGSPYGQPLYALSSPNGLTVVDPAALQAFIQSSAYAAAYPQKADQSPNFATVIAAQGNLYSNKSAYGPRGDVVLAAFPNYLGSVTPPSKETDKEPL